MRLETAGDTRAAQALLPLIRASETPSIPAWAEANGIDRLKLQKALRGEWQRVDVEFAVAVERATNGAVPPEWWIEKIEVEPTPDSSPSPSDSGEHAAVVEPTEGVG